MSPDALLQENKRLQNALATRNAALIDRDARVAILEGELLALKTRFEQLLAGRGGRHMLAEGQGVLFPAEVVPVDETPEHANEAPDGETPDDKIKRKSRPKSPAARTDHSALPVKKVLHELPESERICPDTGLPLIPVGTKVTTEIEYKRAETFLVEHTQVIYGLGPEHAEDRQVEERTAALPKRPLEGCTASANLLAWILVQKYANHCVPRRHAHQPKGRRSVPCYMEDEGRPLGIGVQAQVSNRLELRGSRVRVVSVEGKGATRSRQVRSKKANASEPLITCREVFTRRRNRVGWLTRDEPRSYLSTGWAASGMKAA